MRDYYFVLGKEGEPGKRFIETFETAKEDLGINALNRLVLGINALNRLVFGRIDRIEESITKDFYVPLAKHKIRGFLRKRPGARTTEVKDSFYGKGYSGFLINALQLAFKDLKETGEIIFTSHGRGQQRTWKLKEG